MTWHLTEDDVIDKDVIKTSLGWRELLVIDFSENNTSLGFTSWLTHARRQGKDLSTFVLVLAWFDRAKMSFIYMIMKLMPELSEVIIITPPQFKSSFVCKLFQDYRASGKEPLFSQTFTKKIPLPSITQFWNQAQFSKFIAEYRDTKINKTAQTRLTSHVVIDLNTKEDISESMRKQLNTKLMSRFSNRNCSQQMDAAHGILIRDTIDSNAYHTYFDGKHFTLKRTQSSETHQNHYGLLSDYEGRVNSLFLVVQSGIRDTDFLETVARKHALRHLYVLQDFEQEISFWAGGTSKRNADTGFE
jgi:hypothetical protein